MATAAQELQARVAEMTDAELLALCEAVSAELKRREAAGEPEVPPGQYAAPVRDGCVSQADLGGFETHRRGQNWVATVRSDKTQPGGLARAFWAKASGSWRHLPEGLKAGDVLEVAHEYTTGSGRNDKDRNYVRVTAVTATLLHFDDCAKPS